MSPEQATGQRVDARTDIYSLGAVAYFLLCGEAPFTRQTVVETLNAPLRDQYLPVNERRQDIDPDLADIVHRCLADVDGG